MTKEEQLQREEVTRIAKEIRRVVIDESKRANVGHIGSSLSIADILSALFVTYPSLSISTLDNRDRFVLSKGHAALGFYAALLATDRISSEILGSFCEDGALLGVHPEPEFGPVDFGTGSLGQGLSIAAGAALAARWQHSDRKTIALLSDAECNEGSTWEAAMFAGHHHLGNLVAIVDMNGQQALGYTRDILDLSSMRGAWEAFGWSVKELDGHDPIGLVKALSAVGDRPQPTLILARTTFGKGVSFMENSIEWHYWPLSDRQYKQAISELSTSQ